MVRSSLRMFFGGSADDRRAPAGPRQSLSPPRSPTQVLRYDHPSPLDSPIFKPTDLDFDEDPPVRRESSLGRFQAQYVQRLASAGSGADDTGADDARGADEDKEEVTDLTKSAPQDRREAAREDGGSKAAQLMDDTQLPMTIEPGLLHGVAPERAAAQHQAHAAYDSGTQARGRCVCLGLRVVCPSCGLSSSTVVGLAKSERKRGPRFAAGKVQGGAQRSIHRKYTEKHPKHRKYT
jgi:hypothetical protein